MGLSSGNLMTRCPSSWNGKLHDFSKKGEHWVNRSSEILKTSSQGPARIVKRSLCNALLTFVRMVVSSMVGKWLPKIPQSSDFWLRKLFSWRPSHLGDSDNLRFTTRNLFKTLAFKRIRGIVKQPIPFIVKQGPATTGILCGRVSPENGRSTPVSRNRIVHWRCLSDCVKIARSTWYCLVGASMTARRFDSVIRLAAADKGASFGTNPCHCFLRSDTRGLLVPNFQVQSSMTRPLSWESTFN